jgi:hypothetical protein
MSRGSGRVERGVVDGLRNLGSASSARQLACYVFDVDAARLTKAQLSGVERALRRLAARKEIRRGGAPKLRIQSSRRLADRGLGDWDAWNARSLAENRSSG